MRTKTLLLAAAALAVSLATSQAAPVYSQNVVGYINLPMTSGYNMVAVQFAIGTQTADVVFPNLPDGTYMSTWTGTAYTYNIYDTGGGSTPPANSWYMSDYSTPTNPPTVVPGQACFLQLPSPTVNTFVGTVVPNIGSTYTVNLKTGYNLIGSVIPFTGSISSSIYNFSPPDGTYLSTWNGNGYTYTIYDTGGGSTPPANSWYMSDYSTPTNPPSLNLGQGFFLQIPSNYAWSMTLNP